MATRLLPKVLLTGFEPFGGDAENPSREIVHALQGRRIGGHRIVGAVLPVEFSRTLPALDALLRKHKPALVIALGLAGGRDGIGLERVAINLVDARIPDNRGDQPVDVPVVAGGPAAYFSTLPLKSMLQALQAHGTAASISQTAGTFVCNQVFYALMHRLATRHQRTRGGFIHVPFLPQQAARHGGAPSMALDAQVDGVRRCIATALEVRFDARIAAGAEH